MNLTAQQLMKIGQKMTLARATEVANAMNKVCPMYGISTPDIFHEFIARLMHECGEFTVSVENLNYSTEALLDNFGNRITREQAEAYGRNSKHKADQQAIANTIYSGKWGLINLGNTEPTDGWDLRGSGPIQMTGRANITKFTTYLNKLLGKKWTVQEVARMLRENLEIGIHGACWFFAVAKGLIKMAIDDMLKEIVKKINGGYIGLTETKEYYERAVTAIPLDAWK